MKTKHSDLDRLIGSFEFSLQCPFQDEKENILTGNLMPRLDMMIPSMEL